MNRHPMLCDPEELQLAFMDDDDTDAHWGRGDLITLQASAIVVVAAIFAIAGAVL